MPLKYLIPLLVLVSLVLVGMYLISSRFFYATIVITIGFTLVWKTSWYLDIFGRIPWAEQHLTGGLGAGAGGSWLWYKLLGVVIIVAAILYLTGVLQVILTNVLGTFFSSGVYD